MTYAENFSHIRHVLSFLTEFLIFRQALLVYYLMILAVTNRNDLFQITNLMHNSFILYLYIYIYMLHYNPQHVSSSTLLIFRRTNCIITASGIVTVCKQPYSMPVESGPSPLSTGILYGCLQTVTIPEAVIIQFVLLKMSKVLLETC